MRVVVLTSSRADYGIYLPLLKRISQDSFFNLSIIAFGTHVSNFHGYTLNQIEKDGFAVTKVVESLVLGDSAETIATAQGLTTIKFATVWAELKEEIDLIFCLGDRYEMFAAVVAAIPFQIPIAHIHGGETTLGAIDNIYRHAITLAARYHFTATALSATKVKQLTGHQDHVYTVGALSLDNLNNFALYSPEQFLDIFKIDLTLPSILVTFHPETVAFENNIMFTNELTAALALLDYQVIITMPNADTMGTVVRKKLTDFAAGRKNIFLIESFGTLGYFSCMQWCSFLLGNSSSGIIEAASFGKYVIDLGDRQKGREKGENVIKCPIRKKAILAAVKSIQKLPAYTGGNIYGKQNAADQIITILKEHHA